MKVKDFERLKKLMPMTRSEADAEALMAIRQANKILEASGTNWENVFNRLVTLDVEAGPSSLAEQRDNRRATDVEVAQRREYLRRLLSDAEDTATGRFADFVADLREQFDAKGWLSHLQVEALEKSRESRGQARFR